MLATRKYDRDSVVGVTTRHGPDGLEFEPRWGPIFSLSHHTGPEAHPVSCTMGTGSLSQGYKAAGAWSCHPPQSSAEVKE